MLASWFLQALEEILGHNDILSFPSSWNKGTILNMKILQNDFVKPTWKIQIYLVEDIAEDMVLFSSMPSAK